MESYVENQQNNQGTHKKWAKERIENAPLNFPKGNFDQEEDQKIQNMVYLFLILGDILHKYNSGSLGPINLPLWIYF